MRLIIWFFEWLLLPAQEPLWMEYPPANEETRARMRALRRSNSPVGC